MMSWIQAMKDEFQLLQEKLSALNEWKIESVAERNTLMIMMSRLEYENTVLKDNNENMNTEIKKLREDVNIIMSLLAFVTSNSSLTSSPQVSSAPFFQAPLAQISSNSDEAPPSEAQPPPYQSLFEMFDRIRDTNTQSSSTQVSPIQSPTIQAPTDQASSSQVSSTQTLTIQSPTIQAPTDQASSIQASSIQASSSQSQSQPPPYQSLDELYKRIGERRKKQNKKILHAYHREYCFEMIRSGQNFPSTGQAVMKVTNFEQQMTGNKFFSSDQQLDRGSGEMVTRRKQLVSTYDIYIDVRQRGKGRLTWILCMDKKPVGGDGWDDRLILRREEESGEKVFGCQVAITTTSQPMAEGDIVALWYFGKETKLWLEVEREEGDAGIDWCRWFGCGL